MPKKRYTTLAEYLDAKGISSRRFLQDLNPRLRNPISEPLFSMILRGSRRLGAERAWVIHTMTEIEMDDLMKWPRHAETENSKSVA